MLRESCIRNFLNNFLPNVYEVSQGYVIGQNGDISHQCDIIIYHKTYTPYFHTPEGQRFFPIESVIAVGEVKSKVTGIILDDALTKLCNIKKMRDNISHASIAFCRPSQERKFNTTLHLRDQVITFLLCDEFDCSNDIVVERMKKNYNGSLPRHRVNLLTSIHNGTCLYKDSNKKQWMYPIDKDGKELPLQLVLPDNVSHIAVFVRYLILLIEDTTVLYPELTEHLNSIMVSRSIDLE